MCLYLHSQRKKKKKDIKKQTKSINSQVKFTHIQFIWVQKKNHMGPIMIMPNKAKILN